MSLSELEKRVEGMSVVDMRAIIVSAGQSHDDVVEKGDLRRRTVAALLSFEGSFEDGEAGASMPLRHVGCRDLTNGNQSFDDEDEDLSTADVDGVGVSMHPETSSTGASRARCFAAASLLVAAALSGLSYSAPCRKAAPTSLMYRREGFDVTRRWMSLVAKAGTLKLNAATSY